MKPIYCLVFLLAAFTLQAQTSSQATASTSTLPAPTPYAVVSRDANSAIWQQTTYEQAPDGSIVPRIHGYTELSTGLNHLVNGQWVASSESIDISPDGSSAWATNGQHQVYFPGDIYSGVIKLVTPDGITLQSQPIGLAYVDGSDSVLLAVVTNATGAILSSGNQVIYTNAFAGLDADLLYTYTKTGFEQDVILREQPPDPSTLGLNSQITRIQVLTEFFNAPQPNVNATTVPTAAGNLEDDSLGFGAMQMAQGRAFLIGGNSPPVGVNKQWLVLNGKQFLVEEVPIVSIAKQIDSLPLFAAKTGLGSKAFASRNPLRPLLLQRSGRTVPKTGFLAQATPPSRGLVLDYQMLNPSLTNYTFQGDTTYYISGRVFLNGTNTFEGGAVIKYTNNAYASINSMPNFFHPTVVQTFASAYRPVIFTAQDDDSVGDKISVSTGTPTNYYANPALQFGTNSQPLEYLHIRYAQAAIEIGEGVTFRNIQIVNCHSGAEMTAGAISLRNALFANVPYDFDLSGEQAPVSIDAQNVTFSANSYLVYDPYGQYGFPTNWTASLTNCIFANVTNESSNYGADIVGDHNGFYNSPAFGTSQFTTNIWPFQSVGAGDYYQTNNCSFLNAGTTNIDTSLLADLRQKTTYPPILLSNVTVSANTILNPQAQRDTDIPDLGYHYDPIDYLVDQFWVTNATLTVTNGAVIACYNDSGVIITDGSSINSVGTPVIPNWFVRYSSAQEQPLSLGPYGNSPSSAMTVNPWHSSTAPSGQFSFTKFACPAGGGDHLYDGQFNFVYTNLTVQECEFWGGYNYFQGYSNSVCVLDNNLFARSTINAVNPGTITYLNLTNNLFWGSSSVVLRSGNGFQPWYAFDNAFDSCTFGSLAATTNCYNGYNAYLNCTNYLKPTNATDLFLTNSLAYQTGPFGTFYQPTNSPLIYMGSTNANLVGLYHYTVVTNANTVEGTNIVSIGYHYVGVDQYDNPLDYNGDCIPDYIEDANGNGTVDSGEIGWNITGDLGLNVIITRPRNGSILP